MSNWLAQLVERQTTVREVSVEAPDPTKITEENVLPLQWHLQMVRSFSVLG